MHISMNIVDNFDRKLGGRPFINNILWVHCVLSSILCMNIFVTMCKYIDEVGAQKWEERVEVKEWILKLKENYNFQHHNKVF